MKGYTLIELMVTIAISSILFAITGNMGSDFIQKHKNNVDTAKFINAVEVAKNTALRNEIALSSNIHTYIVYQNKKLCILNASNDVYTANYTCDYEFDYYAKQKLVVKFDEFYNDIELNNQTEFCIAFDIYGFTKENEYLDGVECVSQLKYKIGNENYVEGEIL